MGNKEIVVPTEFKTSKNGFITPLPRGYESQDDYEVKATYPILIFSSSNMEGISKNTGRKEKPRDKGDSFLVGSLGD